MNFTLLGAMVVAVIRAVRIFTGHHAEFGRRGGKEAGGAPGRLRLGRGIL
jgi:hypothetical protein